MSKIKISIIIPLGTNRGFFYEALDSAINQDYDRSLYEIIIINDNVKEIKKDDVLSYVTKIQNRPSIVFYNVNFNNLSKTVNFGLSKARGKYYTILPDDDRILSCKLEVLSKELDSGEYDVVYSLAQQNNDKSEVVGKFAKNLQYAERHPVITWEHIKRGDGLLVNGISTMYSISASNKIDNWDENLLRAEEWEFHLRLLKNGYNMKFVNEYTTEYRVHSNNKSKKRGVTERRKQLQYIYKKLNIGDF